MRRFELILAFLAVFAVFWPVVFGVRPRRGLVAGILALAAFVQIQFEGYRWQMIPFYLVAAGLVIGDIFYIDRRVGTSSRVVRAILGGVGLLLAAALPLLLPVPELPSPSGPEAIGTITVGLVDYSRDELYGTRPGGPREFVAQVWYPAQEDTTEQPVVWSQDWEIVAPALAENMGFPSWFLDHTQFSLSHAREGAPMADGTFPVVIYSHGWEGVRTIALNQIEDLVSNGYIVIAPDHTYGAAATVLADGEVVHQDPLALPDEDEVIEEEEVTEEEYDTAATNLLSTFAGDLVTILDELTSEDGGVFAEIVDGADLNRIGIYGHSTGGGAAVKVCLEDERCDAVLGMDPWVEPLTEDDLKLNMNRPALYMRSEDWVDTPNDALLGGIAARGESVTYWLEIDGAAHTDFLMTPLLSPVAAQLGIKGPIPPGRILPIVDNYLVGFFDVFLLGTGSAALDSVTFPEVTVTVIDQR